jgi:hypothetical protein
MDSPFDASTNKGGSGGAVPSGGAGGASAGGAGGARTGGAGGVKAGGAGGPATTGGSGGMAAGGAGGGPVGAIILTASVMRQGLDCVKIETPSATYYYDKKGAGFASLLDRQGLDWLSFRPTGGFAGNFRGIPNLGPCCHPGNPDSHDGPAMSTTTTQMSATHVRLRSTGNGGMLDVTWDIFPGHATLTVTKMANQGYWFLYEGTPGGRLDAHDFWSASDGVRLSAISGRRDGDIPSPEWAYFADPAAGRALALIHHEDDALHDEYWSGGEGTMTVFGFGRNRLAALITAVPRHFTIGFVESLNHESIAAAINALGDALKRQQPH